jgi:predicted ABC-type ATPase
MTSAPQIFMIGGPNGAGKTTAAMSLMPSNIDCYEYVNADAIAHALSPFKPDEVSIEAGRLMLKRIKELAEHGLTFAFETTMASRSFSPFLQSCIQQGYEIRLIYIWLQAPDLAVGRVAQRVESGGHPVPESTIRMRYNRGLRNFINLYAPLANGWTLYDNSGESPSLVAEKTQNGGIEIKSHEIWNLLKEAINEPSR